MTTIKIRQKERLNKWFKTSCLIELDERVSLKDLYIDFLGFCELSGVQIYNKKVFSALLRESLDEELEKGTVEIHGKGRVLFKGVGLFDKK